MSNIKLYRKTRFTIKRPIGSFRDLEVSGNIKLSGRIRQGSLGDAPRPFEMMALSPMVIDSLKVGFLAMPQPNDVVMIDRAGGIRLSDAPNSTQVTGDLLTSSSKPGYAMKADPPQIGTIIGKAMEPLESGDGEILIFVTRQ